jgi:uncharacterized Zn-binding protein involved in type VI secretion
MPFSGTLTTGLSTDVFIEGKPAATVNSIAINQPPHIPTAGPFQKPPTNQGKILVGSTGVFINGKPAARQGDQATTCNDPADMPIGQVMAVGTVFIGETGAAAPVKPPPPPPVQPKLTKASLGQPGKIINPRWEKNPAKCGEKVKMIVDTKDFEDGTPARFTIWKEDKDGKDEFIAEVDGKIQADKVEALWGHPIPELNEELKESLEGGQPEFFFSVDIEGTETKSQALKLTYLLEIELTDQDGEALDNVGYTITFFDGTKKRGKVMKGRIKINDAPLGKYTLAVDGHKLTY